MVGHHPAERPTGLRRRAVSSSAALKESSSEREDALGDIVGLHLARAYTFAMSKLERRLAHIALTPKAANILWCVDEQRGITQADLARFFKINRSYISNVTSDLIKRGFLIQGRNDNRSRRRGLELTEAGEDLLAIAKDIIVEHDKWLRHGLVRNDVQTAVRVLQTITENHWVKVISSENPI